METTEEKVRKERNLKDQDEILELKKQNAELKETLQQVFNESIRKVSDGRVSQTLSWDTLGKIEEALKATDKPDKKEDELWLEKVNEIWAIRYNNVYYEVHVDATEERTIEKIFAEYGEVTDKIRAHLEKVVAQIETI